MASSSAATASDLGDASAPVPAQAPLLSFRRQLLYQPRPLLQYAQGPTIYSHSPHHHRTIGFDELFFDLVVVGAIAAMGEDLRATFTGWRSVERFILLYGAVISIWRETTLLFNQIDSHRDLFDKATLSVLIVCLAGLGLGAAAAFRESTRAAAAFAFVAHVTLAARFALAGVEGVPGHGARRKQSLWNVRVGNAAAIALAAAPYLAAAIAGGTSQTRLARGLFWMALVLQVARTLGYSESLKWIHRRNSEMRLPVVDVHSLAERYGLITLIHLGETFLATIIEGNKVFQEESGRDVHVVLSVAFSIVAVFSVHTLYFDVDQRLCDGDIHALKRGRMFGVFWMLLHYPLHVGLILGESSLGILVEVVGEPAEEEVKAAAEASSRMLSSVASVALEQASFASNPGLLSEAATEAESHGLENNVVWLFCCAWSVVLVSLILISCMHYKKRRGSPWQLAGLLIRIVVAVLLPTALAIPARGSLSALGLLGVGASLLVATALIEFALSAFDGHMSDGKEPPSEEAGIIQTSGEEVPAEVTSPHHRLPDLRSRLRRGGLHTAVSSDGATPTSSGPTHSQSFFDGFGMH